MKTIICIFLTTIILNATSYTNLYSNTFEEYKTLYDSGDSENIEEAILGFRQLMRKSPRHEHIADMEYIIAQNEKNYTRSLDLLSELYRKRKDFSKRDEVGFALASRYMLQNGFVSALNVLKDIEKNYKDSEYYMKSRLMIGSIYLKLNETKNATSEYNRILGLYSENSQKDEYYYNALFGLANSYFAQEQYYLALGTYNKLLEMNAYFDERAFALYRTALCYEYTGRSSTALEIYNMIIDVYPNTQSRILAIQRLRIHDATINTLDSTTTSDDSIAKLESKTLTKPTIYESDNINVYQFGSFREEDKCSKMLDIITNLGYNGYIVEIDSLFVVRLDIYDDERNIKEMRNRFNREGIPFFKIN